MRELLDLAHLPTDALDERGQRQLLRLANLVTCPCHTDKMTVAACARARRCSRSRFALRDLARGAARNESDDAVISRFLARFGPRPRRKLDLGQAPCRGDSTANVTIVVFSDFECPACAGGHRLLHVVSQLSQVPVRICFKHFPLDRHEHARLAARAAVAAQRQGQFWRYHDLVFAHQERLEARELLRYASHLKLDLQRFRADLLAADVAERVEADLREGWALHVDATPTFFINGRVMSGPFSPEAFIDWIDEEHVLTATRPQARPGAASARQGR